MVLDNRSPKGVDALGWEVLAGDGQNRWFDKASQIIVFANGTGGLNLEHSPGEATVPK